MKYKALVETFDLRSRPAFYCKVIFEIVEALYYIDTATSVSSPLYKYQLHLKSKFAVLVSCFQVVVIVLNIMAPKSTFILFIRKGISLE